MRRTTESYIAECNSTHNGVYNYSDTHFVNMNTRVSVKCPEHGTFTPFAGNHLKGTGCKQCGTKKAWLDRNDRLDTTKFIERASLVFPEYDYSAVEYVDPKTKVIIGCTLHGPFTALPHSLLTGHRCPKCGRLASIETKARQGKTVSLADRSGFNAYRKQVNNLTTTSYKNHIGLINPQNLVRSKTAFNVDHVFSVLEGFKQGIPPEIIAHWTNLRMVTVRENRRKDYRCDKSKSELLADYVAAEAKPNFSRMFKDFNL